VGGARNTDCADWIDFFGRWGFYGWRGVSENLNSWVLFRVDEKELEGDCRRWGCWVCV